MALFSVHKEKLQKKVSWFLIFLVSIPLIPGICQASTIILTSASPDHIVPSGNEETIYGTSTSNRITIESGAKAELLNFSGQNHIQILSSPDLFTVSRSGTFITFQGSDDTLMKISATTSIQDISFNGEQGKILQIYNNQVLLDDQVITLTPTPIINNLDALNQYDDFSHANIDTNLWSINDPNEIFSQSNGYLTVNTQINLANGSLQSKKIFSGNFEFIVSYKEFWSDAYLPEKNDNPFPAIDLHITTQSPFQNHVSMNRCQDYQGGASGVFISYESTSSGNFYTESSTSFGQLRIKREGSEITTYFNEGSEWIALGRYQNSFTDDVSVGIGFSTGANGTFHVKIEGIYYEEFQPVKLYLDLDGDGYGDPSFVIESPTHVTGYVPNDEDCDDTDENINPGAKEICWDGIDQNCDGTDKIFPVLPDNITSLNIYPSGVDAETFISEVQKAWQQEPDYASQDSLEEKWYAIANANECFEGFSYPDIMPVPNQNLDWNSATILGKLYPYRSQNNFSFYGNIREKPKPFKTVQIDASIYVDDDENLIKTRDYLWDMLRAFDNENQSQSVSEELREFLIEFAQSDALAEGLFIGLGDGQDQGTVHYSVMWTTALFVHAFDLTARHMTLDERVLTGDWLNDLISAVLKSSWGGGSEGNRQDNKAYYRSQIAMNWGIITGDASLVANAITMFKHAINEMRPDGSFPVESSRGGSSNLYQSIATGHIVGLAIGLNEHFGLPTLTFEKNNKTLWTAVSRVLDAVDDQVKIASEYGKSCPGGSLGTIDNPDEDWPGDQNSSLVYLFAAYFRESPADVFERIIKLELPDYAANTYEGIDYRSLLGENLLNNLVAHTVSLPTLLKNYRSVILVRRPDIDFADPLNLYIWALLQDGSIYYKALEGWEESFDSVMPALDTSSNRILTHEIFDGTLDLTNWKNSTIYVGAAETEKQLIEEKRYYPALILTNDCQ
jgi:hypothetical protein